MLPKFGYDGVTSRCFYFYYWWLFRKSIARSETDEEDEDEEIRKYDGDNDAVWLLRSRGMVSSLLCC